MLSYLTNHTNSTEANTSNLRVPMILESSRHEESPFSLLDLLKDSFTYDFHTYNSFIPTFYNLWTTLHHKSAYDRGI